jgi:uncharacterized membrane protein YqjE
MFLFSARGRHGKIFLAARLALVAVFLIIVFAFHPHGTALDIVQAARITLLVALVGSAWYVRRRRPTEPADETDSTT